MMKNRPIQFSETREAKEMMHLSCLLTSRWSGRIDSQPLQLPQSSLPVNMVLGVE
jgi:hypothetical protein